LIGSVCVEWSEGFSRGRGLCEKLPPCNYFITTRLLLEIEEMREVTYYSAPELGPTWLHQSELAFDGVV